MGRTAWIILTALVVGTLLGGAVMTYAGSQRYHDQVAAESAGDGVTVVVTTENILANTQLDPLIDAGAFRIVRVPSTAVVPGAVTHISQLRGQTATRYIFANEQVPLDRLGEPCPPRRVCL
jgi:flagella basal body P-ring formation protein FlgA